MTGYDGDVTVIPEVFVHTLGEVLLSTTYTLLITSLEQTQTRMEGTCL